MAETPGFFDKDSWPPHSPNLAPMDFAIFGCLKGMLSGVQYKTKDQLKTAILDAWANLDKTFIETSCRKFRSKLEEVIAKEGGYNE